MLKTRFNSSINSSTGMNSFFCMLGYQPPLFPWSGEPSEVPSVDDLMNRSEQTWNASHTSRVLFKAKGSKSIVIAYLQPSYTLVKELGCTLETFSWDSLATNSVQVMWARFPIIRQINHVTYKLKMPAYCISPAFHISLLKKKGYCHICHFSTLPPEVLLTWILS